MLCDPGRGRSLMLSEAEARARILKRAELGEAIEFPLPEALGLVLAEPAVADVNMPLVCFLQPLPKRP
ncbi:MAG TPA: hypothetical protein VLD58_15735 [Gemmatimonadales bacterium]|nr:hypothetical protein [Gemmatimonadales bacterium]